jgi:hypothetical protein
MHDPTKSLREPHLVDRYDSAKDDDSVAQSTAIGYNDGQLGSQRYAARSLLGCRFRHISILASYS